MSTDSLLPRSWRLSRAVWLAGNPRLECLLAAGPRLRIGHGTKSFHRRKLRGTFWVGLLPGAARRSSPRGADLRGHFGCPGFFDKNLSQPKTGQTKFILRTANHAEYARTIL